MKTASTSTTTATAFAQMLSKIVPDKALHAKLLNTMSYMEHIGATKIARTQSGPDATFTTLKHAAEEARHAFFLKKLALKLMPESGPNYHFEHLLAPLPSRQYLYKLDVAASRLAKGAGLSGRALHDLAYLLVTFAIEVRADELYPIYESFLEGLPERLSVQSIIAEETGHLAEMEAALACYPEHLRGLTAELCTMEAQLFEEWVAAIAACA